MKNKVKKKTKLLDLKTKQQKKEKNTNKKKHQRPGK